MHQENEPDKRNFTRMIYETLKNDLHVPFVPATDTGKGIIPPYQRCAISSLVRGHFFYGMLSKEK